MNEHAKAGLTVVNNGAVAFTNTDADLLRAALTDQHEITFGSGDEPAAYGADVRTTVWQPPATITEGMINAARERQAKVMMAMEPASEAAMTKWLVQLGILTAVPSGTSAGEAETKVRAMCILFDDAPAGAFTKGSLRRAVDRFQFFPTARDMALFVSSERDRLQTEAARLGAILEAGPRQGTPKWSKEAAEAHREKLRQRKEQENRELARALKEREASASSVGSMKPLALSLLKIAKE